MRRSVPPAAARRSRRWARTHPGGGGGVASAMFPLPHRGHRARRRREEGQRVPDSGPRLPAPAGRHRGPAAAPPRVLPVAARALSRPRLWGLFLFQGCGGALLFSSCRVYATVLSVSPPPHLRLRWGRLPLGRAPSPAFAGAHRPLRASPPAVRRPGEAGAGAPSPGQEETHRGGLHPRLDGVCQRARAQQHSALCGESRFSPTRELPQAEKR